uniref:NMT1-like family protein n=1 Tax=Candidatus Kentrum sp. TUN TaxID=2126343 RepID=A0A451AHF6_9GAMM|nr:MAG: NMT1-like family protein [Candidatus Kentron sp. TUN]VFK65445.1 MAG: NMT1-like family protein [Candidatus Kentron sp. TUN]
MQLAKENQQQSVLKMKSIRFFCAMISLAWLAMSLHVAIAAEIKIATGSKSGVYYPVGQAVSQLLKVKGIDIGVIPTAGSEQTWTCYFKGQLILPLFRAMSST